MGSVEINTSIGKILKGGVQQGTPHQKAELQHLGIAALFAIIERKIEINAMCNLDLGNGIKKVEGLKGISH